MEICFAGKGIVGSLCQERLERRKMLFHSLRPGDLVPPCDLLLSAHWPHIFNERDLAACRIGALNVHNGLLPWGRGADAPSWALVNDTPHGATVHWLAKGIDTGDIFYQERLEIPPTCTTDTLYRLTVDLELKVFDKALEMIQHGRFPAEKQSKGGSFHNKRDFERILRAATTNKTKVLRET